MVLFRGSTNPRPTSVSSWHLAPEIFGRRRAMVIVSVDMCACKDCEVAEFFTVTEALKKKKLKKKKKKWVPPNHSPPGS